jgi:hypothetical protein
VDHTLRGIYKNENIFGGSGKMIKMAKEENPPPPIYIRPYVYIL